MTELWSSVVVGYNDFMAKADPRVDGWFMMDTPWPSLALTIAYIVLVEYALPKYMENRQPYGLRNAMIVYNFAMVALSGYIFFEFGMGGWFTNYTFGCQLCDYSKSPQGMRMLNACWWFFISKFIEFIDTFIFCLRKKSSQITFLHVFHHGIMPFSWYWGVKFGGGGMGTFHALLNSFIHFMMYIYYGLAGLGPQYQKYLWWKKYMTKMQITQFLLVVIHSSQMFFVECSYTPIFAYWILAYAVIFLVLFAQFYIQAYNKPKAKKQQNGTKVQNGAPHLHKNGVASQKQD